MWRIPTMTRQNGCVMKVVDGASIPAIFIDCEPHIAEMLDDDLRRIVPALEIHLSQPENEDEIIARLQGHALAMVYMAYLSERILSACRELECVIYLSTGIATHVDLAAARRLNITVRGVEGYGNRAVAEHTIALMFAAARRVTEMDPCATGRPVVPPSGNRAAESDFGVDRTRRRWLGGRPTR